MSEGTVEIHRAEMPLIAVVLPYFRSEALLDDLTTVLSAVRSTLGSDKEVLLMDGWCDFSDRTNFISKALQHSLSELIGIENNST